MSVEQIIELIAESNWDALLRYLFTVLSPILIAFVTYLSYKLKKKIYQEDAKDAQICELVSKIENMTKSNGRLANMNAKGYLYSKGIPIEIKQEIAEDALEAERCGGVKLDKSVRFIANKLVNESPKVKDTDMINAQIDKETKEKLSALGNPDKLL
jgi:hypothetical protein